LARPRTDRSPTDPIDPTVAQIIRRKALSLVRGFGFHAQDLEDLEQRLALHVLERRARFDPHRGTWPAFVYGLLERFGATLARSQRRAARRGLRGPVPENVPARGEESNARSRAVCAALAALPEDLRAVAELVMGGTVVGAARALGRSRSTVYARLRELRAQTEFRELGDIA
jgi:RNA polymerase sigma-70 factor, ECF subfamily